MRSDLMALLKKAGVGAAVLSAFYFSTFYARGAPNKGEAIRGPSDIACLVIMVRGSGSSEGETKMAFLTSASYFMGRYEAGHTKEPLAALVRKEVERQVLMEPAALNKEQAACGAMVSAAGRLMKTMGSELQKQGR